jgi:hypothetical protein
MVAGLGQSVNELAWRDHGRVRVGEAGQVAVAGDQVVGVARACECDEVVIVGVRREPWLGGWVVDDERGVCQPVDVFGCGGGADPAAKLCSCEHVAQLVQQRWACDEIEASLCPGREDLARRTGGRDQGGVA